MDRLKAFLKDHMGVTLLFALAATGVIGFYLLTTRGVFVIYPICVVVFFYVVYMIIAWVKYCAHSRNLDRLSQNAVCAKAFKCEHEKVYNTMNALHSEYNNRIAKLEEKNREDKRFISGYIHNLKTPIMSIAGAVQGLEDLIHEYDESIDDPLVNSQDHHDIAKDMSEWI